MCELARLRYHTSHPQHQIGQPLGSVDHACRLGGLGHGNETRGFAGERGKFRRDPFRREDGLVEPDRAAGPLQEACIGLLILIERMRQRHQNAGPPDRAVLLSAVRETLGRESSD